MKDETTMLSRGETIAEPPAEKLRKGPVSLKTAVAVGLAVVVAVGGAIAILAPKGSVSTDAAYLEADSAVVAPRVRGLVSEVLVQHNQQVRRGDPLVRIDSEEFDARVASAQAELLTARAGVQLARAAVTSLVSEQELAASNVRAQGAVIRSVDAQSTRATADARRYEALVSSGAVAKRDADAYTAAAITAQSEALRSRAQLDVSRNQAQVVGAKRATLLATTAQAEAGVARAEATLVLALQDQGHTVIRAPIDGVVGARQVEPGDYVQPGTRLLNIVPLRAIYVVANFKETQVSRMIAGQAVIMKVDALPGVALKGTVESFAPGSGSQFSLLPFEPGTGEFH